MTFLRIGDSRLYVEDAGTGDPVLVLHGGFGCLDALRPLTDALTPHFRVLGYDRPGHGRSPDIDADYSYPRDVETAVAFLDAHRLPAAHIVGYSDGAVIALMLALAHPDRVRSLVAIGGNLDPTAFADTDGGAPQLTPPAFDEDAPDPDRERYDRLSPDGADHADVVLGKLARLWRTEPQIAAAELSGIPSPALIMSADHDTIRPDHSLLIAASIPHAQLCIVPGTTHDLIAERPELVGLIVREFLAGR